MNFSSTVAKVTKNDASSAPWKRNYGKDDSYVLQLMNQVSNVLQQQSGATEKQKKNQTKKLTPAGDRGV